MKQFYELLGISKQAHHQHNQRQRDQRAFESRLLTVVADIRRDHPCMGARIIYQKLRPAGIGRDRFEQLLFANGLRVKRKKNFRRTTYAQSLYNFPNRINGLELTRPNQVWQTDITYFEVGHRFYFLSLIIDIYTRKLIGYAASDNMRVEANLKALKMALRQTKQYGYKNLIHHSDRGKQFIEANYLKTLMVNEITPSHAYCAMENAYAERINGIIKNDYLKHFNIKSFQKLKAKLKQTVKLYNEQRPHQQLPGRLSPTDFEKSGIAYVHKVFNFSTLINKEKRTKKESLH